MATDALQSGFSIEPGAPPRPLRVLVVDDSDAQRRAVRQELSDMNVDVFEARSGIGALKEAHANAVDVITLDIEMKDMDGYRVLRQLRAGERTRSTPVIMISGRGSEQERFRAEEEGAIAYFTKPFAPGKLRALVAEIVTRVCANRSCRVATIVRDEELLERLRRMVSAQGYQFRALEAVADLSKRSRGYDVLLLDLQLPDHGAYRALDELPLLPEALRPRVLGVMSSCTPADIAQAFHRGLSDFVRAPFYAEELTARIEHLVSLEKKAEALRTLGTTDALTGLPNRACLEQEVERACAQTTGDNLLGVVMVDIDHFKLLNDTYGHPFGDEVLRKVGQCLKDCLRGKDLVGRYGGEEFMLLIPNANSTVMGIITERLRRGVESLAFENGGDVVKVTASFGTCMWGAPAIAKTPKLGELVRPADAALYEAKRGGRNRACQGPTMVDA